MIRRGNKGAVPFSQLALGLVVVVLMAGIILHQRETLSGLKRDYSNYRQRIKLPPSEVLAFITLGYDNVYADYLWLQSIQNFGQGWITEVLSTEPIYQYFDTMTDVDPHFIAPYRFANLIIGDNRQDWKRGQDILRKGVFENPGNYDIPYLGLYDAIWQTEDNNDARWFAHFLDKSRTAPPFMKRLEEYIERKSGRYQVAFEYNIRYLLEYRAKKNDVEATIVERRLGLLLDDWYRSELSDAAYRYKAIHGHHPELIEASQILM